MLIELSFSRPYAVDFGGFKAGTVLSGLCVQSAAITETSITAEAAAGPSFEKQKKRWEQ